MHRQTSEIPRRGRLAAPASALLLTVAIAGLAGTLLVASPSRAGRAARSTQAGSARLALVTPRDVFGLKPAAVPSSARRAWSAVLPSSARAGAAIGVLRGPKVLLVSRAASAGSAARAGALARTLRRLSGARLARLDAAAVGHNARGPGVAHVVWSAGTLVGQVSVLGAGRAGAGLARTTAAAARGRVAAALAKTAWDRVLDQVRPDGSVSVSTALQAFSLAIAPLPGVRVPAGRAGRIPDGTLAINWALSKLNRMTSAERAAVEQVLARLHGAPQHSYRVLAERGVRARSADWQPNAAYQKQAEEEASAIRDKIGFPLTLKLHAGTGPADGSADGYTAVTNAQGNQDADPPTDCWISVSPSGQNAPPTYLKVILAHEVFHCFQGQINGVFYYNAVPWVIEGGANWAACNVVPGATDGGWWSQYLETPGTPLFEREYGADGFFSLLSQHGIDLWSRWPAIIHAAQTASFSAYANAVGAQQETILWDWASSYAQDASRGADWGVSGPCKPAYTNPHPVAADVAQGSQLTITVPTWTTALVVPYSTADVVKIDPTSGHVRLSSSGHIDEFLVHGETAYCTSSGGSCTCPGGSETLERLNSIGGTFLAFTGGPTGAEATVTGMSLDDYCNKTPGGSSCSVLPGNQLRSILGLTSSTVLDGSVVSSDADSALSYECDLGAWSGPKPTTAAETLQRARSGKAAAVAYETWTQGTGRNADQWPSDFAKMTSDFDQGVITPPGPYADAGWSITTFQLQRFGHEGGKGIALRSPGGPTQGLAGAGGCWWNSSTLTVICLVDIEAANKPILTHLNQLAAIAVPRFLG